MGSWNTLMPVDQPTLVLSAPDNNDFTFEGTASGYLGAYNYNDTYPVFLHAGYAYDFVTVNSGEGYGYRGSGLYGAWTDILIYDKNGDLLLLNRAMDDETIGYDGDAFNFSISVSGTYYVSQSLYFTWDSGSYYMAVNVTGSGAVGPDTPTGGSGGTSVPDSFYGTADDDNFAGFAGNDTAYGGTGNDLIYGNQDSDQLHGERGDDTVFGGKQDDTVTGGAGDDQIYGNVDSDLVQGNDGNDSLFGGQGADTLEGGAGADLLHGNLGDDMLTGGASADLFTIRGNGGNDIATDFSFAQGDRIQLVAGQAYVVGAVADGSALIDLGGGNSLTLSGIAAGAVGADWIAYV